MREGETGTHGEREKKDTAHAPIMQYSTSIIHLAYNNTLTIGLEASEKRVDEKSNKSQNFLCSIIWKMISISFIHILN